MDFSGSIQGKSSKSLWGGYLLTILLLAATVGVAYVIGILVANRINENKDNESDRQHTAEMLSGGCRLSLGQSLPPSLLSSIDSAFSTQGIAKNEYRGTLISYMSHGCPACLENADSLTHLCQLLSSEHLRLVIISYAAEGLETYQTTLGNRGLCLLDDQFHFGSTYSINVFPCNILCKMNGIVTEMSFRPMSSDRLHRWISRL